MAELKFTKLRTNILELYDKAGNPVDEPKEMAKITTTFYRNIFAGNKTDSTSKESLFNIARPCLNRCFLQDAFALTKPIIKGEVLRALKEAPKGKAPGPDAIPVDI
ncbi:hypothetical protein DSO57_1022903 [Entomophthora muscae]|uniref:Uncharacterized protein n=1 Tax=Entomophthora muscae TaxID=34485 RepID=A0ACC2U1E5_9FUNG|nr:hypothetical protein DSO57_1022903 [Entomophthora muscae]